MTKARTPRRHSGSPMPLFGPKVTPTAGSPTPSALGPGGRRALTPLHAVVTDGSWPGGLVFHPGGRYLITKNIVDGQTRDVSNTLWDLEVERAIPFPGGLTTVPGQRLGVPTAARWRWAASGVMSPLLISRPVMR